MRIGHWLLCFMALSTMTACARSQSFIVLLPESDGRVGSLQVQTSKGTVQVDKPFYAVSVTDNQKIPGTPKLVNKDAIESKFAAAIGSEPAQQFRFNKLTFYFHRNSTEIIPESQKDLNGLIPRLVAQPPVEIYVVGHADRAGTEPYNRQLSHKRALNVHKILASNGLNSRIIVVSFLGESKPRIDTPDGVEEPLNRRVELVLKLKKSE